MDDNPFEYGFKLIGSMTDAELIEEIAGIQKGQLEKMNSDQLKSILVDFRASMFRHRLVEEANFSDVPPYLRDA